MIGSQTTQLRHEMQSEISSLKNDTDQRFTALEISNTRLGSEVQALRNDIKELYSLIAS